MNDLSSIDHAFTRKLTEIIRANLENENFGVKELAFESGMSRFNLNRKLQFIFRKTINQFIREVRLQKAMEMLRQDRHRRLLLFGTVAKLFSPFLPLVSLWF